MRLRKIFALVGALTVLGGCILLYLVLDMTLLPSNHSSPLTRETHTNVTDDIHMIFTVLILTKFYFNYSLVGGNSLKQVWKN